jgi:hypothetical protein
MNKRRIISAIVGVIQSIVGFISAILAILLFLNILEVQIIFSIDPELLPLYLLIIGLFATFSVISGLFLIRESRGIA